MKVKITNIQRFCLHDGPGIRTTVFLKGCNLKCPWCSNPENINFEIEEYIDNEKQEKYGYEIDISDLEVELLKDKEFFKTGGGITFSGGEALLQFEKLEPLLKSLKEKNINLCLETALSVPTYLVEIAIKYIEMFYIDIKILEDSSNEKINGNPKLFKENVKKVLSNKKNVIFRIPVVPGYTFTQSNINKILEFIADNRPDSVEIFKIHTLGEKKYKMLNKTMMKFKDISDEELEELKEKITKIGVKSKIINI